MCVWAVRVGCWWLFSGEVGLLVVLVSGGLVGAVGLGCWWLMVRLGCGVGK